jgi:hypothetical protein
MGVLMDDVDVKGPDESGAMIQLATRWAERHAPAERDSEHRALARFRAAYQYIEAVVRGVEPPQTQTEEG